MYVQHFGFSSPLFSDGMPQDDAVFHAAAVKKLVQDLEIALTRRDSVAILAGVSGTGKTTIAADALKNISTRLAFSCISHPPLTANELLEQLLTDFGFEPYKMSRVERLQIWRQFLSEMAATDTRVCLLVENAECLSSEVVQFLHNLTCADAALSPGANVVLTTIEAPESLLATQEALALNQRVRLRCRIDPLTEDETRDYLAFKCRGAGSDGDAIFASDLAPLFFELSGGIVRVIDNLLESALISAAGANEDQLTAERILQVANQQFGISRLAPEELDNLLKQAPEGTDEAEEISAEAEEIAADAAADEIPTLTEFVTMPAENQTMAASGEVNSESLRNFAVHSQFSS